MISTTQAIILGLLQGLTELFPVSSLGHSVILPRLLGWNIHQDDPFFLTFLVFTHLATATVLFVFFYKDWIRIINGVIRSLKLREIKNSDHDARLGWLLIAGTIPAGILGVLFEQSLKSFFASAQFAAFFLILNGGILFMAEVLRRKKSNSSDLVHSDEAIARLSWVQAIKVGLFQSIALIPGFSRTGASIAGGLLVGLSHEDALRYSFLLATPIIGAAAILKLPELVLADSQSLHSALLGSLTAGFSAYFSVKFLVRYFQTKNLTPFAIYCCGAGVVVSVFLLGL